MLINNIRESLYAYVINLDRSPDRLAGVDALLAAAEMRLHRVTAVDGRHLSETQMGRYDNAGAVRRMLRPLSMGEVACCLSHEAALAAFVASGMPYGLILEDDAAFPATLPQIVTRVAAALEAAVASRWAVVNLCRAPKWMRTPIAMIDEPDVRLTLFAAHHFPMGAVALLWSRQGALRYLERGARLNAPFDVMVRDFCNEHGGGFALDLPPVGIRPVASDINAVHHRAKTRSKRIDLSYFLRDQQMAIIERLQAARRKFLYRKAR